MQAYVRKLYNGHYFLIQGIPEKQHENATSLGEFSTRRQAMRYAAKNGYDLIIRSKTPEKPKLPGTGSMTLAVSENEHRHRYPANPTV